ncbi:MAG: hypothetical protein SFH39_11430 [Candidatus Magnetobacterium sp. LHC-1]
MTTVEDIVVTNHYAYIDVAVVNAVWDEWKLDEVFKHNGKRDIGIEEIARILAINHCIDPGAKLQTPQWFRGTALRWILDVDSDDVVNKARTFKNHNITIDQYR